MPGLDPVVFLSPSSIGTAIEVTVASLASPTELNSVAASQGDLVVARTVGAASDDCVIYYADTTSDAQSLPYIVTSATSGVKFVAIAGRYRNGTQAVAALTASRVVTADASKNLDTPATVTTGQAWAFTSTLTVVDGNLTITGSSDATKALKFEVDSQTANDTLTIDTGAQTDSRTATFPVLTSNSILALSNATLTSGRVPFATTNGILTDSSRFTYSDSGGGGLSLAHASSSFYCQVSGGAGFAKGFVFNTGGVSRWIFQADATAETGSDAGSPFTLYARTDAGAAIDTPISIVRAAGGLFSISRPIAISSTTDSTSKDTGSIVTEGGIAGEKNFISAQGIHAGVSSTATAAGTTTLTSASRRTQIFTGTTTQTLQLPAANLFGSGIAVEYIVINRSTGTVTAQRAGSDTFDGGGTTDAILTNTTRHYFSNGSNQWHTIA